MKNLVFFLMFSLWPCISWAAMEEGKFDVPKMYEDFISIQRALEKHDNASIEKICAKNEQSVFFCTYAKFIIGKLNGNELIKALPNDREGFYRFFKYDEYISRELYKNKISNPYGNGPTFVYIDQLFLLSYSTPAEALPALLRMYKHSQGFWGEYIQDQLVKRIVFYDRFKPELLGLEKDFPQEIKRLREAHKLQQSTK